MTDTRQHEGEAPPTLVVIRSDATPAEIEEVRNRSEGAGLDVHVSKGAERALISIESEVSPEFAALLVGMPGVERVVGSAGSPTTRNLRVAGIRPLVPPAILLEQMPL